MGIAAYAAAGNPILVGFGIGFLLAALLAAAAVSSPIRQRRAARFLKSLAYALDRTSRPRIIRMPRASAPIQMSPLEEQVYSALLNMRASKTSARAAARYAMEQEPSGDFETLFRLASRKAAA